MMPRLSLKWMAGQRFRASTGHGSHDMSRAKFCNRRKKMLVQTVPASSTRKKCSGRVSKTGKPRIASNALSRMAVRQRIRVGPLFQSGRLVHDVLPGAGGDLRVAGREIGAGDLQVDGGLPLRLVLGVKQSPGLCPVASMEAVLLAGGRVFAIEDFTALKQDEPLSHVDAFRF